MAKDPSFPFLAQDYLVDTIQWTRDMKSLHVDMLCVSWINGVIDADENGNPLNYSEADIELFKKIRHKWVFKNGVLVNNKLEIAREGRKRFREMQSERGKKSAESRAKKNKSRKKINHGSTTVQPMVEPFEKEYELDVLLKEEDKKPKQTPPEFQKAWDDFKEFRKKIKKPMTPRAEELNLETLRKLAGKDVSLAIRIINQSIERGWQGLFEIKENSKTGQNGTPSIVLPPLKGAKFDTHE